MPLPCGKVVVETVALNPLAQGVTVPLRGARVKNLNSHLKSLRNKRKERQKEQRKESKKER